MVRGCQLILSSGLQCVCLVFLYLRAFGRAAVQSGHCPDLGGGDASKPAVHHGFSGCYRWQYRSYLAWSPAVCPHPVHVCATLFLVPVLERFHCFSGPALSVCVSRWLVRACGNFCPRTCKEAQIRKAQHGHRLEPEDGLLNRKWSLGWNPGRQVGYM